MYSQVSPDSYCLLRRVPRRLARLRVRVVDLATTRVGQLLPRVRQLVRLSLLRVAALPRSAVLLFVAALLRRVLLSVLLLHGAARARRC